MKTKNQPSGLFNGIWIICFLILVSGVGLTLWGVSVSRDYYQKVARIRFDAMSEKILDELDRRMELPVYGLEGAAGLYASSKSVERLEFRSYVEFRDFAKEFPGVLGFGFMERVNRKDLELFVQRERADNAPDFGVFSQGKDPVLYVNKFLDPLALNRPAWGFDAGSEPRRRVAIERAINTGQPALTKRLFLFQADKKDPGFLWLIPIYKNGSNPKTPEARQAAVAGLVFAPITLNRILENITGEADDMVDLELFEDGIIDREHSLWNTDKTPATEQTLSRINKPGSRFHMKRQIEIGGQTWVCVLRSNQKFEENLEQALPLALGLGGLLSTVCLVLLFWSLGYSRNRAVGLAQKMTENLRISEAEARKLAMVVSRTDHAVLVSDLEGRIQWVNKGFSNLTGYESAEVLGKAGAPFLAGPATDPEMVATVRQSLRAGEGFKVEVMNHTKQGKVYWAALEAQPLHGEGEEISGFMVIASDISNRKISERELLQAKQDAEAANRAKSEFLAVMSHEIRTPMNGVIGMTSLLLDTKLDKEQRDYTEVIRSSGETLLELINDILDFSKIESGKFELESAVFNVRDCVEGTFDLLAMTAAHKGIDLLYEIKEGVPVELKGDVTRIRQILVNLVGNALKFTKKGEVEVTVQAEAREKGLYELQFAVRDTGIGIAAQSLERLFKPFTQVDASTTRKYGGTGLGLAISRRLAELMGGRLRVESKEGVGSTFYFTVQARSIPSGPKSYVPPLHLQLEGRRLLLVDDNGTNLRILTTLAVKWGVKAVCASSGEAALRILEKDSRFDFIVVDMQMPEMDGVMLAREIKKRLGKEAPPLLLLTSLGLSAKHYEDGLFNAFLTKPAKPSQILKALVKIGMKGVAGAPQPLEAETPVTTARYSHIKILIAEDNHVNQKVAQALLFNLGYSSDVAANGLEALEALGRQTYDIVFMDMQMPEMDGLEATRQIRENQKPGEMEPWIIALTANAMNEDRDLCLKAGMNDYLSKPIQKESLALAIERALAGRRPK